MEVKCKVNFIVGGRFIRVGSVMDMEQIPQALRIKKYIEKLSPDDDVGPQKHTILRKKRR